MARFIPNLTQCGWTRREFLWQIGGGFTGLALADLLAASEAKLGAHFPAAAKHCVFLFMNGGPSQVDTFDPKPELARFHGQPYTGNAKVGSNGRPIGNLMKSRLNLIGTVRAALKSVVYSLISQSMLMNCV